MHSPEKSLDSNPGSNFAFANRVVFVQVWAIINRTLTGKVMCAFPTAAWNHNIHYHGVVLRALPSNCRRALDVGCGQGLLARRLARHCEEVIAIDSDHDALARARNAARDADSSKARITFVEDDVMICPFASGSFDFISAVATLHHLPLLPALERFRSLLKSGGVLAVVGLYRESAFKDYVLAAAAVPANWAMRWLRSCSDVGAPVRDPQETLSEIRSACDLALPGAVLRQHLFFRYSLIWRKP